MHEVRSVASVAEDDFERLFERWFAVPLNRLREIPNRDGGFGGEL